MRYIFVLFSIFFLAVMGVACSPTIIVVSPVEEVIAPGVTSYGNGVYYFAHVEEEFPGALAQFLEDNPKYDVSAIAVDDNTSYGWTQGYFVIVHFFERIRYDYAIEATLYKNEIYYFNHVEEDFARALAGFLGVHPNAEVLAIAADNNTSYGWTQGYFVLVAEE